jgi:type VI secretion system secreted protein VgrG
VINAPSRIVLNGGGSYIKIEGGDIEIGTSGAATFKGAMKELASGGSASAQGPALAKPSNIAIESGHHLQYQAIDAEGKPLANRPYVMFMPDGSTQTGKTDASGKTKLITTTNRQQVQIYIEDAEHQGFRVL